MSQLTRMDITKLLFSIQKEHLSYFASDDETVKQQKIQPLRDLITQYLSLIKHRNKFSMPEFERILQHNIEERFDFNAYETQQAFDILEKYASNLMAYPWRKEFRSIKLYCGFFKHNVARHLFGAEKILNLMGYQKHDNIMQLDGPVDPDMLIEVSRNCFVASCECKILHEIYNHVLEVGFGCSYEDIYNIRKCVSGSSDSIVRMLCAKEQAESRRSLDRLQKIENIPLRTEKNGIKGNECRVDNSLINLSPSSDFRKKNQANENREEYVPRKNEQLSAREHVEGKKLNSRNNNSPVASLSKKEKMKDVDHEILKLGTQDDHIRASVTAINSSYKDTPEQESTREQSWGYVDQTLRNNSLSHGYGNRNDVLDEFNKRSNPVSKIEEESFLKGKPSNPQQQMQQDSQEMLMQQNFSLPQNVHRMQPNSQIPIPHPVVQDHHQQGSNIKQDLMSFDNYPPGFPHGYPFFHPDYCQSRCMFNAAPFNYNAVMAGAQMSMYPYPRGFYPPYPMVSTSASSTTNSFPDTIHSPSYMDSNVNSNVPVMQSTGSGEDNRKSLYDNVPTDKVLENHTAAPSDFITHGRLQLPHSDRPVVDDVDDRLQRKFSDISLSNTYQTENEALKVNKNQTIKLRKSEITNSYHSLSDKSSPASQRRSSIEDQKRNSLSRSDSDAGKWPCPVCTYLNTADRKVCEVCCRSRTPGPDVPLQSGGHECPKCTLVNNQNATHCSACNTNLTDSPTYI